uniref:Uncharacterized protein n=1 Tax=viral metagenome TaxID=1070528 RepID=A0A6C0E2T7_9ZZZZ
MLPSNKNNNSDLYVDSPNNTTYDNYIHNVEDVNNLLESSLESSLENRTQNITTNPELDNKSYYYQAKDYLNDDINTVYNNCLHGARIHLCLYNVNTSAKHPFLEFYLIKNRHDDFYPDILCFPSFFYYNEMNNDISTESQKMFKMLFIDVANIKFDGYLLEETNHLSDLYLFYEYKNVVDETLTPTPTTDNAIGSGEMYRNDIVWKVVVDEIVNSRLVCNFPIDDMVTYFFLKNPQFMFLYKNNNNIIYETPTVVYHGVNASMLYFQYIFGIPKTNYDGIMGPFYYFTNYKNAVNMSIDSYKNKNKSAPDSQITQSNLLSDVLNSTFMNTDKKLGIIRSVIFLGVNKVPMNYPNEESDNSYHSSILSSIDNENAQINRISDHNGLWAEKYDSVYIGKLLLDNGKFISGTPLWVVKDYNQQSSLSYHYLSTNIVKDEWLNDNGYTIL